MNVQPKRVRCIPGETVQLKKQRKRQPNMLEFVDDDWLGFATFLSSIQSMLSKVSLAVLHRYTKGCRIAFCRLFKLFQTLPLA
jgi:phosphoenolpyruvate carboxylase